MPVTLFYHYYDEADPVELASWVRTNAEDARLTGRVRVATEGVNATLGGDEHNLSEFEQALARRINAKIDYKRSPGDRHAFPALQVRVVDELVTLGVPRAIAPWRSAAPSLTPDEFLAQATRGSAVGSAGGDGKQVILLDARNSYETAIGHMKGAILPRTRAFVELPTYLANNAHEFEGHRVLLYCTGGVRCETLSALLSRVANPGSVAQLRGGIHRFLERFPDGAGLFLGKNLVFDGRGAVPAIGAPVVGKCVRCEKPWDDYEMQARCAKCRARMLVCSAKCCSLIKNDKEHLGKCDLCLVSSPPRKRTKVRAKRRAKWLQNAQARANATAPPVDV